MTDVETINMYFNCMNLARKHGLEMKVNVENIRFEIYHSNQVVFYAGRLGDVFIFLSGVSLGRVCLPAGESKPKVGNGYSKKLE